MTDKPILHDFYSIKHLDRLVDLDDIVHYWAAIDYEPEGYEKEAGLDVLHRAVHRLVNGGGGTDTLVIPPTNNTPQKVRKWIEAQRLFANCEKEIEFNLCNYYGAVQAKQENGKFFWGLENYDGVYWEEIPEQLYKALCVHYEQCVINSEEGDE
jgi:hypothetical protein